VAWLRDGSLAFAAVTRARNDARSELYVKRTLDEPARLVAQNNEHFVIYVYGAPGCIDDGASCPSLAYMVEEANGVGLRLVYADSTPGNGVRDVLVAVGRPFYVSWSPEGSQLLWHTGGALRENPAAELGMYDVGKDRRRTLPHAPGAFRAPAWSPKGGAWLAVVEAEDGEHVLRSAAGESERVLETSGVGTALVWSPDGSQVAYAERAWRGADFYGPVWVVDAASGERRRLTDDAFNVLGFFWSPDGRKLAYLSRLDLPDEVWMQWRVFDTELGQDRGYTAFLPSPLMRFMIHSFDQYAQSHRFWSPDGRYLVYAERDDGGTDRVKLVDVEAEKGSDPILVDEGSVGVWSWE
jgi:TolB protein